MADDEAILPLIQNNDVTLTFTVTDPNNNNAPFDLTGCTVAFIRKATKYVLDTDSSAQSYPVTPDPDQVANRGKATVSIPRTDLATSGMLWGRLDVTKAGKLRTAETWKLEIRAV